MTVIRCRDCHYVYDNSVMAFLMGKKQKHEEETKHTMEFIDSALSSEVRLQRPIYRAICLSCLQYFDKDGREDARGRVIEHQRMKNERIEKNKPRHHETGSVREILVERRNYTNVNDQFMKGYRNHCECGWGYDHYRNKWAAEKDLEKHQSKKNKDYQKFLKYGLAEKLHEGIRVEELDRATYLPQNRLGKNQKDELEKTRAMRLYEISDEQLSPAVGIERGNDEVAFWLRASGTSNYNEIYIAVQLEYLQCPMGGCRFEIQVEDKAHIAIEEIKTAFTDLYEHFLNHYNPLKQGHNSFENVAYGLLQQLVVIERNRGRGRGEDAHEKTGAAMYSIIKEYGIPQGLLVEIIHMSFAKIGDACYEVMKKQGLPEWAANLDKPPEYSEGGTEYSDGLEPEHRPETVGDSATSVG